MTQLFSPKHTILEDIVSDFFKPEFLFHPSISNGGSTYISPIEVKNSDNEIEVKVELPGVNKKDITITYQNQILEIESKKERDDNKPEYTEIQSGHSIRRLKVGEIDFESAKSTFKDGVLLIVLPKSKRATKQEIKIS